MEKYTRVFFWNVINKVTDDEEVYLIDKAAKRIFDVADISAGAFLRIIKECEDDTTDRYEFFCVEKVEEGEQDDNI